MKKIFLILFSLIFSSIIFGQNPDYELILKNDTQVNSSTYEFDIVIKPKSPTTSFELAQQQLIMNFNTGICTGSLNFEVVSGTSDLNSSQQPTQSKLSISGNELRVAANTPPGAGSGTIINSEKRIARFRLSCSQNFENQSANIVWKNAGNPFTKVFAYVNGGNTDITQPANHLNQLDDTPLPVELQSFKATNQKGSTVELEWSTATEVNNYGFEIERKVIKSGKENSEINSDWEKVAFIEGAGNSNSTKVYSFKDKNPVGGTVFAYRLKQIDIDGTFKYSDEIEVKVLPSKYELFQNYPNPFNPTTKIKFSLPENAKVKVSVYDVLGRELKTLVNKNFEAGYHSVNFDANKFTSGVYIYSIETKKFTKVRKMVLIK